MRKHAYDVDLRINVLVGTNCPLWHNQKIGVGLSHAIADRVKKMRKVRDVDYVEPASNEASFLQSQRIILVICGGFPHWLIARVVD